MSQTRNLLATLVVGSTVALTFAGVAAAEPAAPAPLPIDGLQAPGLSAMQSLSPAIQQAAGDPSNAAQMLMAAASAFTQNGDAPAETHNLAAAVSQFVSDPPGALAPLPQPVSRTPHRPVWCPVPRRTWHPASIRPTPSVPRSKPSPRPHRHPKRRRPRLPRPPRRRRHPPPRRLPRHPPRHPRAPPSSARTPR